MILYNVTVNIEKAYEQEWLDWMKTEHIPEVLATGLPIENRLLRLLTEVENGGTTYTSQYTFRSMDEYITYQQQYAPALQAKFAERYKDKSVTFRSLLEVV